MDDEKIVTKVLAGDKEQFGILVERYEATLRRYVNGMLLSDSSVSDIVQETFVKAYINLRSYKQGKKFSSWLYRIAHNEAVNYIRKHHHEITASDETWFDRVVDEKATIADRLDVQLNAKHLYRALQSLKPKYREPLMLSALNDKSYQEISDILRIPIGTVGTRVNRAKRQLKQVMAPRLGGTHGN